MEIFSNAVDMPEANHVQEANTDGPLPDASADALFDFWINYPSIQDPTASSSDQSYISLLFCLT